MMYPRNATNPPTIAIGALVDVTDGSLHLAGASILVQKEGQAAAAGTGTLSVNATSGIWSYAPAQSETDTTCFRLYLYKTGTIPVCATVVTSDSTVAGRTRVVDATNITSDGQAIDQSKINVIPGSVPDTFVFTDVIRKLSTKLAFTLQSLNSVGFASPAFEIGDAKLSKDGTAFSNTTNLPAVNPAGSGRIELELTDDELDADVIDIFIVDQSNPKVWADTHLVVRTVSDILVAGRVVSDPNNSGTSFKTNLSSTIPDHYAGSYLTIVSGVLKHQTRNIVTYDGTTKIVSVDTPFTATPADGVPFVVIGRKG